MQPIHDYAVLGFIGMNNANGRENAWGLLFVNIKVRDLESKKEIVKAARKLEGRK